MMWSLSANASTTGTAQAGAEVSATERSARARRRAEGGRTGDGAQVGAQLRHLFLDLVHLRGLKVAVCGANEKGGQQPSVPGCCKIAGG